MRISQNVLKFYLNVPEADSPEKCPLNYEHIQEQQQTDSMSLARQEKYPA